MNALMRIRVIGLRALALVGALAALTLIINLPSFDEELHPDLAALASPQPVSMESNALPYAYGFAAANDQDPRATGVEIIERLRERYLSPVEWKNILGNPPPRVEDWMRVYENSIAFCDFQREIGCAERLIADFAEADITDERLTVLLNRLETMLQLDRFEEDKESDIALPFPDFRLVMVVSRIRLAMSFDEQPTDLVLDRIGADVRFWKMMLRDGDSLPAKMNALAGLSNSMGFLPALMRARDLSPAELARIAEVLTPLSDEERDIGEVFLDEAGYLMRSTFVREPRPVLYWLFAIQKNATMNDYYAISTVPMRQRAALGAGEYYELMGQETERYSIPWFSPPLYNLGGNIFILDEMSSPGAMTVYISRVHDVDGQIALVLLQAEILANPDEPVERVVGRSQYRNLYTREPMDYDAASGILSFECLYDWHKICAVKIGRD